jgi:hypothetical protein
VESHGGKVWAESKRANLGTTFFLSLPVMEKHHAIMASLANQNCEIKMPARRLISNGNSRAAELYTDAYR